MNAQISAVHGVKVRKLWSNVCATGSTTSSRVMEFMSNQASEMFQASWFARTKTICVAVASLVIFILHKVQSFVHESLFELVTVNLVHTELYVVL